MAGEGGSGLQPVSSGVDREGSGRGEIFIYMSLINTESFSKASDNSNKTSSALIL